jgi:hypothetical protein
MKGQRNRHQKKARAAAKRRIVATETTEITTEPKVEIRKPATLAQALTEPPLAVVKPETTVSKTRKTRNVA